MPCIDGCEIKLNLIDVVTSSFTSEISLQVLDGLCFVRAFFSCLFLPHEGRWISRFKKKKYI